MKRTTRIEIDLIVDEDGVIQVGATNLTRLNNSDQAMCFLTGQPNVTCQCSECTKSHSQAMAADRPEQRKDIEVVFTHVRDPSTFTAYINPQCTGQQAIRGLIAGDENGSFIEPAPLGRPYELAIMQSGIAITPNMTFAEAGVIDGDKIEVRQGGQGGGVPWDAIQLSLAYGVGTGAGLAFVKALTPILQQIVANRGSRSVEIEVAGKRVKIVGKNSIKEVVAAIKELANSYGLDEAPESKKTSRVRARKEARHLESRAAKVSNAGPLATTPNRPPRPATGKRTNNTTSAREKRKKNS